MQVQVQGTIKHGKVKISGLWVCEQPQCDGTHHYYVKAAS